MYAGPTGTDPHEAERMRQPDVVYMSDNTYHLYRASFFGVAIVLYNDVRTEYLPGGNRAAVLRGLANEGRRRAWASEQVCHVACMAYEEGARVALRRMLEPTLGFYGSDRAADRIAPSYTQLRNFLIGELDVHEIIACRVAMRRTVNTVQLRANLYDRDKFRTGERGWL
jgi:hypothetical protein